MGGLGKSTHQVSLLQLILFHSLILLLFGTPPTLNLDQLSPIWFTICSINQSINWTIISHSMKVLFHCYFLIDYHWSWGIWGIIYKTEHLLSGLSLFLFTSRVFVEMWNVFWHDILLYWRVRVYSTSWGYPATSLLNNIRSWLLKPFNLTLLNLRRLPTTNHRWMYLTSNLFNLI